MCRGEPLLTLSDAAIFSLTHLQVRLSSSYWRLSSLLFCRFAVLYSNFKLYSLQFLNSSLLTRFAVFISCKLFSRAAGASQLIAQLNLFIFVASFSSPPSHQTGYLSYFTRKRILCLSLETLPGQVCSKFFMHRGI